MRSTRISNFKTKDVVSTRRGKTIQTSNVYVSVVIQGVTPVTELTRHLGKKEGTKKREEKEKQNKQQTKKQKKTCKEKVEKEGRNRAR
jgi:heme exporter protein D